MLKYFLFLNLLLMVGRLTVVSQTDVSYNEINLSIPSIALLQVVPDQNPDAQTTDNQDLINHRLIHSSWVNYSSIVAQGSNNKITVSVDPSTLPPVGEIKVKALDIHGNWAGNAGNPTEEFTLDQYPQEIITNIGSCYTGVGAGNGYEIAYYYVNDDADNSSTASVNTNAQNTLRLIYTIQSED